ncbi:MAG: methyltransferase domain-containing protein, partial [Gammaproteobacteria bacterium]
MEFGGDIGLWQRKITEGPEGISRRLVVLNALEIKSGQAILDLGCGGGHLVREIALAVGDKGRAAGLDTNSDQLASAGTLCAGLPAVELIEGSATDMMFENGAFDGLASIQMLEYIDDVDRALAETRRILKPGGKAALVSVLWDHWRFHGADPDLNDVIHDAWRTHCPHQMLPFEISGKLEKAGFGGIAQKPIAFINASMHENSFALWASKMVAAFAIDTGVEEKDATLWLNQLSEA